MNHHMLPLRLLIAPQIGFLFDESPYAAIEGVSPTTNRVPIDESPFATTEVINPTIDKVLANESPSITTKVVNPTIDSEGNGGG